MPERLVTIELGCVDGKYPTHLYPNAPETEPFDKVVSLGLGAQALRAYDYDGHERSRNLELPADYAQRLQEYFKRYLMQPKRKQRTSNCYRFVYHMNEWNDYAGHHLMGRGGGAYPQAEEAMVSEGEPLVPYSAYGVTREDGGRVVVPHSFIALPSGEQLGIAGWYGNLGIGNYSDMEKHYRATGVCVMTEDLVRNGLQYVMKSGLLDPDTSSLDLWEHGRPFREVLGAVC